MSFEQEYGSLSYTDGLPDYYGLPLEQINKTYEVLNQKYEINLQKWSQLRSNIANSAILSTEQASIDKALNKANMDMKNIVDTGNFHLADLTVNDAINNFTMDKDMKAAFSKKASKESYFAMLDDGVKNKRFLAGDAEAEKKRWESLNQNYTHHDDKGELVNAVQQEVPHDFVDTAKMFVDLAGSLKGSDSNIWDAYQGVQRGMKSKNMTLPEYYKYVTEDIGVSDERHLAVMEMVMNDPRVKGYNNYKMGLDMMKDYGTIVPGKSTYEVDEHNRIKMRELGWGELNAQGLVKSDDGTKIYRTAIVRNSKGEMLDAKGNVVDSASKAARKAISEYSMGDNEQASIYAAITMERFKTIGQKYTEFSTAYSWNTTKYTFVESSNREANAAKKIKKQDEVPLIVSPESVNKEGHVGIGDILKERNYTSSNFLDVARGLYNQMFPNAQFGSGAIDFINSKDKFEQIKNLTKSDTPAGKAAREYVSMVENQMQTTVEDNSYYNLLFNTMADKYGLDINLNETTTKFTNKNAPLNAFVTSGGDPNKATITGLTPEAILYCKMNGIVPDLETFKKHIGLNNNDVEALRIGSAFANNSLNKDVNTTVRNKQTWSEYSGFSDESQVAVSNAIKSGMKVVLGNPTSVGKVILSEGTPGFNVGANTTIQDYGKVLYRKHGISDKLFNNGITTFLASGTNEAKSFKMNDGKILTISASDKINIGRNIGLMVPVTIKVTTATGLPVSNAVIGYDAGKIGSGKTFQSPAFNNYDNPLLIAEAQIKNYAAAGTDAVDKIYYNDNGKAIPAYRRDAGQGVHYISAERIPKQNLETVDIDGTRYYYTTEDEVAARFYSYLR